MTSRATCLRQWQSQQSDVSEDQSITAQLVGQRLLMGAALFRLKPYKLYKHATLWGVSRAVHGKAHLVMTSTHGRSAPISRTGYVRSGRGPLPNTHV